MGSLPINRYDAGHRVNTARGASPIVGGGGNQIKPGEMGSVHAGTSCLSTKLGSSRPAARTNLPQRMPTIHHTIFEPRDTP